MSEHEAQSENQTQAFLKIWTDSFAKLGQAAFTFSPDAVPPEMLRQVRSGMFQALAQSWDEFLRSPQFMEGMKQVMDNAVAFRKLSTDILTKARHDLSGVAQNDIEGLAGAIAHTESRVMQRLEALSEQVAVLTGRLEEVAKPQRTSNRRKPARRGRARSQSAARNSARRRTAPTHK
jgi:hypothetical protein